MGCRYCENILSISPGREPEVHDCVLCESENFVVVPTLGSLVEGWVLIITKKHLIRIASLQDDHLEELDCLSKRVCHEIMDCYGPVAIFEHGPSRPMQAVGCGVDHAHLHIVPTHSELIRGLPSITDQDFEWVEVDGVSGLRSYRDSNKEYLYVEQPVGTACVTTSQGFGSQLFRRVIAHHIGEPCHYDWKSWEGAENVIRTVKRLAPRLEGIFPKLAGNARESR